MKENTGLFVKMWVKMLDDDWFISLNCTERGLWCQLLLFAKRMGDSGTTLWRSWGHFSQNFGITRTKAVQICAKMEQLGKLKIRRKKGQNNYIFEITIPNYKYYQELRGGQKLPQSCSKKRNFGGSLETQDIDIDIDKIRNIRKENYIKEKKDYKPIKNKDENSRDLKNFDIAIKKLEADKKFIFFKNYGIDVNIEIEKAKRWSGEHGARTVRGYKQFFVNWLNRALDRKSQVTGKPTIRSLKDVKVNDDGTVDI